MHGSDGNGGFQVFTREEWAALGRRLPNPPSESDIGSAVAAGGVMAWGDVADVYGPLCQMLARPIAVRLGAAEVARPSPGRTRPQPFVVGVTGSVAGGKSTVARVLQALLGGGAGRPRADVVATDSFLYPNRVLQARGLMERKGFPESYDQGRLIAALTAIRAGEPEVAIPVYSHESYDIVAGEQAIRQPDIVVVEGLNALQAGIGGEGRDRVSSQGFFDFSLYLDAAEDDVALWFGERLLALRTSRPLRPGPFSKWLAGLSEAEARSIAESTWSGINLVNLRENVAPTRGLADVIVEKGRDHRVTRVLVRSPLAPGPNGVG